MDSSLRELERAAASGGQPERSAMLKQRLRAGLIDQEKVELMAYCGDRAAQELLECRWCRENMHAPPNVVPPLKDCPLCGCCLHKENLGDFVHGLLRWGHYAMIRAGLAVAEATLPSPHWHTQQPSGIRAVPLFHTADGRTRGKACLNLVREFLANPCEAATEACKRGPPDEPLGHYAPEPAFCRDLLREIADGYGLPGAYIREVCHGACQWEDEHKLGKAARAALIEWAMEGPAVGGSAKWGKQ
jgi:hypothetical protein